MRVLFELLFGQFDYNQSNVDLKRHFKITEILFYQSKAGCVFFWQKWSSNQWLSKISNFQKKIILYFLR